MLEEPMSSSSNGISFPCKSRLDGKVMGSRSTRNLCNPKIDILLEVTFDALTTKCEVPMKGIVKLMLVSF